jgi:hypothetical protein
MNIETGEIMRFKDNEALQKALNEGMPIVEISDKEMTKKQDREKHVSLHDARSILGRRFTSARKARKAALKSAGA